MLAPLSAALLESVFGSFHAVFYAAAGYVRGRSGDFGSSSILENRFLHYRTSMTRKDYLYQHHTWPELGEVAKRQPVVVLPIGSVEDHGPHLPLDVDNFLIWSICEAAAQQAEGDILLMPIIPFGYETHHMDFPGTIDITIQHLLDFVLDVTKSVAHHGFRRILIADGHGSNMPILDLVARRTILETEALCAPFLWPSLALEGDPASEGIRSRRYVARV